MLCPRVRPTIPVIARGVVILLVRKVHHEAFPGRFEVPLTGVFGAGEAVGRRQLEQAESVGVANPGVVRVKLFMNKLTSSGIELAVLG